MHLHYCEFRDMHQYIHLFITFKLIWARDRRFYASVTREKAYRNPVNRDLLPDVTREMIKKMARYT